MFQVRIRGRGGQGVVTAAELLSVAAFREGRYAQAFRTFGSEWTGAPVVAFCRIADREIRVRSTYTATASQGLLYMVEALSNTSGLAWTRTTRCSRPAAACLAGITLNATIASVSARTTPSSSSGRAEGSRSTTTTARAAAWCVAECPSGSIRMEPERS